MELTASLSPSVVPLPLTFRSIFMFFTRGVSLLPPALTLRFAKLFALLPRLEPLNVAGNLIGAYNYCGYYCLVGSLTLID